MKSIATSSLAGLSALVLSASTASAQVCNGTAPFSAGHMRVGAGLRMPNGGTFLDGEFAVSAQSGLYGGATVSIFDPELTGADGSTFFGGFIGKPMAVDAKKAVEMCPQGFIILGDNYNSIGGGFTLGRIFTQTSFDLVPFGGASLHRDDFSVGSDINLDLLGGVGFVLSKKWTVRPYLTLPLTNNGELLFGVMGYLNFGAK